MDKKAKNFEVTINDFDSILTYSDQASWSTPDPSSFNYTPGNSPWLRGTYHNTSVIGASVTLNFTGPTVSVYGAVGPAYSGTKWQAVIDNLPFNYTLPANQPTAKSELLFSNKELTYRNHQIVLRNLGGNFLLDYIETTIQLAPPEATVYNDTYEETHQDIKYNGRWNSSQSQFFSGGGSMYTNADGASFELTFQGSTVYVLGDKKNDHRGYTVTLDGKTYHYNGTSGCGGAFGPTCGEQRPCLKFMGSNLAAGDHTLKLVNNANGPAQTGVSVFDLDSIVVTVPSKYGPHELSDSTNPFVKGNTASNSLPMMSNSLLLLVVTIILVLRSLARG